MKAQKFRIMLALIMSKLRKVGKKLNTNKIQHLLI